MDRKFYVSLEAARLLKEKGYNEEVELFYNTLGELEEVNGMFCCDVADNTQMAKYDYLSAPTKAEAIDWLDRKIKISIGYYDLFSTWHYDITPVRPGTKIINNLSFKTRLEAEEAAIIDALELL